MHGGSQKLIMRRPLTYKYPWAFQSLSDRCRLSSSDNRCREARLEASGELLPVEVLPDEDNLVGPLLAGLPGPASALAAAGELQQHMHTLEDMPKEGGRQGNGDNQKGEVWDLCIWSPKANSHYFDQVHVIKRAKQMIEPTSRLSQQQKGSRVQIIGGPTSHLSQRQKGCPLSGKDPGHNPAFREGPFVS